MVAYRVGDFICFFVITSVLIVGQAQLAVDFGNFKSLLIFGVVYAAVGFVLVFGRFKALSTITASQLAIALIFLVMPHFYAFGTNGNYWQAGGSAAIFWLLAGLTLLGPLLRACFMVVCVAASACYSGYYGHSFAIRVRTTLPPASALKA